MVLQQSIARHIESISPTTAGGEAAVRVVRLEMARDGDGDERVKAPGDGGAYG